MRSFPTRPALDLVAGGAVVVLAGILTFQPAVVAWGGALLLGLAIARSLTLVGVARVRAAGFEMVWREPGRVSRVERGQTLQLRAEVCNRDTRGIRYAELRAMGSPCLSVSLEPKSGEVPAGGRLPITVTVGALRVGRHGLFGLGLELQGRPAYFEIPLTFANAYGVEVWPSTALSQTLRAHSGSGVARSGTVRSRREGDSTELRELRDYQSGDSLRKVAWKASARRGRLLVRHYELEEQDAVWFVLDASVELWAGTLGRAPLDLAIDATAWRVRQHLRWGHRVGLVIVGGEIVRVEAGRGRGHARSLLRALALTPGTSSPERSSLGEAQAALHVLEHLRALMPVRARGIRPSDVDAIAGLASQAMSLAPFGDSRVAAGSPREATLRTYLAAFGIASPPRLEPRSLQTDRQMARVVGSLLRGRRRANLVYVVSPVPAVEDRAAAFEERLSRLPRHQRRAIRWLHVPRSSSVPAFDDAMGRTAWTAAQLREQGERQRGRERLSRLGIAMETCNIPAAPAPSWESVA